LQGITQKKSPGFHRGIPMLQHFLEVPQIMLIDENIALDAF
jgi:hypothetical protein